MEVKDSKTWLRNSGNITLVSETVQLILWDKLENFRNQNKQISIDISVAIVGRTRKEL